MGDINYTYCHTDERCYSEIQGLHKQVHCYCGVESGNTYHLAKCICMRVFGLYLRRYLKVLCRCPRRYPHAMR